MNYDALIIIDMQTALVEAGPYNKTVVVTNIKELLHGCRERKIPVIYIQHDGGTGDELEHGSIRWTMYKEISPLPNEKVFEKHYNSAFRRTRARSELRIKLATYPPSLLKLHKKSVHKSSTVKFIFVFFSTL